MAQHRAFVEGDRVDWVPDPGAAPAGHGVVTSVTGYIVTIQTHHGAIQNHLDSNLRLAAPLPDHYAPAIDPFWVTT